MFLRCQLEILEILIERGAQLDALNQTKNSPLDLAIYNQFTSCARLLIQHGCNVNLKVLVHRFPVK